MKVKILHYSAGEAEAASGRSIENQRNDRRAGLDPEIKGRARYDLRMICRLRLRQMLADLGIGPRASQEFLDEATEHLFAVMITNEEVWTESAVERSSYELPTGGDGSGLSERLRAHLGAGKITFFNSPIFKYPALSEQLGVEPRGPSGTMGMLIMPSTGEFRFSRSWFKEFGEFAPNDPALHGAVISLAFLPLSHGLVRRLPRPILDLIPDEDDAPED